MQGFHYILPYLQKIPNLKIIAISRGNCLFSKRTESSMNCNIITQKQSDNFLFRNVVVVDNEHLVAFYYFFHDNFYRKHFKNLFLICLSVLFLDSYCGHKMFEFSSQNFSYFDKVLALLIMAAAVCTVTFFDIFCS